MDLVQSLSLNQRLILPLNLSLRPILHQIPSQHPILALSQVPPLTQSHLQSPPLIQAQSLSLILHPNHPLSPLLSPLQSPLQSLLPSLNLNLHPSPRPRLSLSLTQPP